MNDLIARSAAQWDLEVRAVREDIAICGSPERCDFRSVIECTDDIFYVIENLAADEISHKQIIIARLNRLFDQGLYGINPYLRCRDGGYIAKTDGCFWQISRFVDGVSLKRPEYIFDQWRGGVLADFLIALRKTADNTGGSGHEGLFSIIRFIDTLYKNIETYEPVLKNKIQPVMEFLARDFIKNHDRLPAAFCHGDFHALNIIWSGTGINAVIDWEFSGIKPEIYDVANMIGCIGIENPEALAGPLVTDFILRLKESAVISDLSWIHLIDYIIALRFAWLSEWLRHQDHDMIEMESVYLKLLANNANDLKQIWKIGLDHRFGHG